MLPWRLRFPFLSILLLLVFGSVLAYAAQAPASSALEIDGVGKGAVPLDGPWRFHLGDDPDWAVPALDDSQWERISADRSWAVQGHPGYSGMAWYRKHIVVTPVAGAELDLEMAPIHYGYEVYWNGVKIGNLGEPPPHETWYRPQIRSFAFPASADGSAVEGVLAIRVWSVAPGSIDPGNLGGLTAAPILDDADSIQARIAMHDLKEEQASAIQYGHMVLSTLVCIAAFVFWARNPKNKVFLWFGLFVLAHSLIFLLTESPVANLAPYGIVLAVMQPLVSLQDSGLWLLLLWLFELQHKRGLRRVTLAVIAVSFLSTTIDGVLLFNWARAGVGMEWGDAFSTAGTTLMELYVFVLLYYGLRQKLDPARLTVALCGASVEIYHRILIGSQQAGRFTHWTLSETISAPWFYIGKAEVNADTIFDLSLLLALVYALVHHTTQQRRRQAAIEAELKSATEIQRMLIPETPPDVPGFKVTSAYRPAREVGGDFFQVIPLESGSALIVLGDVSGKGLKAAMTVAMIVGTLRALADGCADPAELLAQLNRRLYGQLQGGFATCIALRLDADGKCAIASAGHPAPFLNNREVRLPGALPLGIDPTVRYEDTTICLTASDHFALYTDGLVEARSQSGELYGFERLETLLATKPSAAQATEAAVNFGQDDDITVLTFTRLATGQESTAPQMAPSL